VKRLIATLAIAAMVFTAAPVWAQDYEAIQVTLESMRITVAAMSAAVEMYNLGQVDMGLGVIIVFTPEQLQEFVGLYTVGKAELTTLYGQLP